MVFCKQGFSRPLREKHCHLELCGCDYAYMLFGKPAGSWSVKYLVQGRWGSGGGESSWAQSSPPMTYRGKARGAGASGCQDRGREPAIGMGDAPDEMTQRGSDSHHLEQFELMAPGSGRSCADSEISRA